MNRCPHSRAVGVARTGRASQTPRRHGCGLPPIRSSPVLENIPLYSPLYVGAYFLEAMGNSDRVCGFKPPPFASVALAKLLEGMAAVNPTPYTLLYRVPSPTPSTPKP